jgi:hypothetical protein
MMVKLYLVIPLLAIGLTGCGSGKQTESAVTDPPTDDGNSESVFLQHRAIGQDILSEIDIDDLTTGFELPIDGIVTYEGVIEFGATIDNSEVGVSGIAGLSIDFEHNQFSGSVTSISDQEEVNYIGTIFITNGVIDRIADIETDFMLEAQLEGSFDSAEIGSTEIEGRLFGDFYSSGAGVAGVLTGNLVRGSDQAPISNGAFILITSN